MQAGWRRWPAGAYYTAYLVRPEPLRAGARSLPLARLSRLTTLNLSYAQRVRNLSPLAGLTQLTTLDLRGCRQIRAQEVLPLVRLPMLPTVFQRAWRVAGSLCHRPGIPTRSDGNASLAQSS